MKRFTRLGAAVAAGMIATSLVAGTADYVPTAENVAARKAFAERRFGIFIHWGLYALFGQGEWYLRDGKLVPEEYAKSVGAFYPSKFDARAWAKAFKRAGAKYVTVTSRHHDGFSMFDSKASDYTVMRTPFGRDPMKELADACRAEGLAFGFYYSLLDWAREDFPWKRTIPHAISDGCKYDPTKQDYDSYERFMKAQLSELLTNYGPIQCIWFDGEWCIKDKGFDWKFDDIYGHIHSIQPGCLVVNNHHHATRAGEDVQTFEKDLPGENKNGLSKGQVVVRTQPLETCDTMGYMWGYTIKEAGKWKSRDELLRLLVGAAGKGANLLLNIGPRPDGCLPEEAVERLEAMGDWLSRYGAAIYGTEAGPDRMDGRFATTRKGDEVYLFVFDGTAKTAVLKLDGKPKRIAGYLDGKEASFIGAPDGATVVTLPDSAEGIRVLRIEL